MRRPNIALAVLCALTVAACGDSSDSASTSTTTAGPIAVRYAQYGIGFRADPDWSVNGGLRPHIATISSGPASAAVWRFPRSERLPRTRAELQAALRSLVAAARRRSSRFKRVDSRTLRIDGRPAVEIRATEVVRGRQRATRTAHIYAYRAEIVVDGHTAPTDLGRADAALFEPLLDALTITRPNP